MSAKRATAAKKPNDNKRAIVEKKPNGDKRAALDKKPRERKRAIARKKPSKSKRAMNAKKPNFPNRANRRKKPNHPKRATCTKKPKSCKRAIPSKKPRTRKRAIEEKKPIAEKRNQKERRKNMSKKNQIEKVKTYEEYQQLRAVIRMLVRAREDFQGMRKRMDNRMGRKADGEAQVNLTERAFTPDDVAAFNEISDESRAMEKDVEKKLERALRRMPIYDWLKEQKGIGTIAMGHICGSFDIYKAETVSKMWQYSGMNPGLVRGKKRKEKGDSFEIIVTDDFIRGDKLTSGYVAPFNKALRTALLGVMGDGFIKSQNRYCMDFYYPMKQRLEREESTVEEISKAGAKPKAVAWKDAKAAHRHRAAIRYMVKMFIADLYAAWRPMHELNVRKPYQEEYLGHVHQKAA